MAMMQTLPPVPKSSPQDDQGGPPLAQMPDQGQSPDVRDKAQSIMRQIMDSRRANDALASQYPAAAKEFRTANEALKAAMLKIVSEVQNAPGSNPAPPG